MKFTLPMPTVQVPRAPSMFISTETPKLRVPFLSLLVEPRPLKKWLAVLGLCLYLVFFSGNLLGPVFIGIIFRTGLGVAFFNILLFFISVEIACTIPGVDRYKL